MNIRSVSFGLGTLALGIVVWVGAGQTQEGKKGSGKGYTPQGWKALKLTDEQRFKLGKIHDEYKGKISALNDQINALKAQEKADLLKVLTADQKKLLVDPTGTGGSEKKAEKKKSDQ